MAEPSLFARVAGNALYYGGMYAASRFFTGSSRKRGIGGANFQGKFGGAVKRPKYAKLDRGYAERVTYAGIANAPSCLYLGFTSIPTLLNNVGYSRIMWDICISILRDFYKKYHPGRIEFETPDQDLYVFGLGSETLTLQTRYPTGGSMTTNNFTVPTSSNGVTLRTAAAELAIFFMDQWAAGREPFILYSSTNGSDSPRAQMWLNTLHVKAKVTNIVTIQNQSLADDGGAATPDADANTTVDVSANPLKGRMFYMKHVVPEVGTGFQLNTSDPTSTADQWGAKYLKQALSGTLLNVINPIQLGVTGIPASGCWQVIPKADYFKNCTGVKDVGLEPGVQKTFKLRFNFNGPLTNFLRGEFSNYYNNTGTGNAIALQSAYKSGFGQCVLLCFEKRLRQTGSNITVAHQIDTYIRTNIYQKKQYMAYHVETNV